MRSFAACVMAALVVAVGQVGADTVVLKDGTRIEGRADVDARYVTVRSGGGILTLPRWRVSRVEPDREDDSAPAARAQAAPPAGEAPGPLQAVAAPKPEAAPPARAPGAPRVEDVLDRPVEVDFAGAPVIDILTYLQDVTGVNMLIGPAVDEDDRELHVHLHDMPLRLVLEHVLEPLGFGYSVRAGNLLYVDTRSAAARYEVRVYPVRDLLRNMGDATLAAGGGLEGGFQLESDAGSGDGGSQYDGPRSVTTSERTESIILLMNHCCAGGRWRRLTSPSAQPGRLRQFSDRSQPAGP